MYNKHIIYPQGIFIDEVENKGIFDNILPPKGNFVDDSDNIYIMGEFDDSINTEIIPYLNKMISIKESLKNPSIDIFISSNGGAANILFNLLCFLDVAHSKGIIINTTILSKAYSCGSILACYGDNRKMSRYSNHLMHYGSISSLVETPLQQSRLNKNIGEHFSRIVDIYAKHSKLSKSKIQEMMSDDDLYLSAEECLKMGLVDEIIG